ncbi:MAG: phosphoethanolamine transferase [Gammaproteobacteria bacterium]
MKAKHQLAFAFCWTGIYSFVFNRAGAAAAAAAPDVDMWIAFGWVYLLFLVATYSRIFFFAVIPVVFVASGLVAFAERLTNAPISRDIVASVFQTNWQEMLGITGGTFWLWIAAGLVFAVACSWHFLQLNVKPSRPVNFIITSGFIVVYFICADKTRPFYGHESNEFHWRHPYDFLEYTTNYVKEAMAMSRHENKYDIAFAPAFRRKTRDESPLQIVLILGESARADHFGVYGYPRNTTPLLQNERNLMVFTDVRSCGTTTAVSVRCLMTRATGETIKTAGEEGSFISVFRKLGFRTSWVSEQAKFDRENTVISSIASDAETTVFQDNNLNLKLNEFKEFFLHQVRASGSETLSVFHMMGSHFPYQWMYPVEFGHYTPTCPDTSLQNCPLDFLINTYDNTIRFTDFFLSKIIEALRSQNAMMVYIADHGEYLGERGRFLHGQETDDSELRHVPMIWWVSNRYVESYPDKVRAMRSRLRATLSHDNLFHSVLDCAGIESDVIDGDLSICRAGRAVARRTNDEPKK